jgi:hypothetical protein
VALPADQIVGVPISSASVRAQAGLPLSSRPNSNAGPVVLFRFYGGLRWDAFRPGGAARPGPGTFFL